MHQRRSLIYGRGGSIDGSNLFNISYIICRQPIKPAGCVKSPGESVRLLVSEQGAAFFAPAGSVNPGPCTFEASARPAIPLALQEANRWLAANDGASCQLHAHPMAPRTIVSNQERTGPLVVLIAMQSLGSGKTASILQSDDALFVEDDAAFFTCGVRHPGWKAFGLLHMIDQVREYE